MRVILAALLLVMALPAHAADDEPKCNEAGTQLEMSRCAADDFAVADRELNLAYQEKMASLPAAEKTKLRNEQRAWLRQLRPGCKKTANDQAKGGSMWSLTHLSCMAGETRKRTEALKND